MSDDGFSFEDTENYRGSDALSLKEISLKLYNKAVQEGSKEMTQGGVFTRLINGEKVEIAIPNQREIFINSVEMIYITLLPHIEDCNDDNIQKKFKEFDDKVKEIENKYQEKVTHLDKERDSCNPRVPGAAQQAITTYNQKLERANSEYELTKINTYKKLLIAISYLLKHNDYFDEQGGTGMG